MKNSGKSSPVSCSSFNKRALIQVRSHLNTQNAGRLSPMSCIFLNMRERTQTRNCSNIQNAKRLSLGSQNFTVSKHSLRFLTGWTSDVLFYAFCNNTLANCFVFKIPPFSTLDLLAFLC